MAYTLSGTLVSSCSLTHVSGVGLGSYSATIAKSNTKTFTTSDITKLYHATRSLTGTTPETLDVTSGLTDGFNVALNFATIKGIFIVNKHATATLTLGGGANPLFNALPPIPGLGHIELALTITTSGTVKNILATPSGTMTYDIVLVGT